MVHNTQTHTARTFGCTDCGRIIPIQTSGGTGYGMDADGHRICYRCIGENERCDLISAKRATLYLTLPKGDPEGFGYVSNWPGSFRRRVLNVSTGRHNMAGKRYDVTFRHAGHTWRGTQYGDNTQIVHCRRVKEV